MAPWKLILYRPILYLSRPEFVPVLDLQSSITNLVTKMLATGSTPEAIGIAVSTLVADIADISADISADRKMIRRSRLKHAEAQAKYMKNKKKVSYTEESLSSKPLIKNDISTDNPSIISSFSSTYVKPMYVEVTELNHVEATNVEITEIPLNQVPIEQVSVKSGARARGKKIINQTDEIFFDDWPSDYGEQFWKAYPKKNQKAKVITLLTKIRSKGQVSWAELISGLARYEANLPEWQFWCWPTKWLTEERWNSNPTEEKNGRKANGSAVIRASDKFVEAARRFNERSFDFDIRSGTSPPHVRLLPER